MKTALPPNPGGALPRPRPPPPPGRLGRWAPSTTQHQGQDDKPEGASTCKVRSQCHLISEQVSLSYEMSLQFALAPLGGGFLKQRDRLGVGRGGQGQGQGVEKQEGGGEKETEDTDIKHHVQTVSSAVTDTCHPPEGRPPRAGKGPEAEN